jgi:hypothetical protein
MPEPTEYQTAIATTNPATNANRPTISKGKATLAAAARRLRISA